MSKSGEWVLIPGAGGQWPLLRDEDDDPVEPKGTLYEVTGVDRATGRVTIEPVKPERKGDR